VTPTDLNLDDFGLRLTDLVRSPSLLVIAVTSDREVARRLGRALVSVTQKRCQLGIPNPFDRRRWG
jgi:hypothetical protein